MITSFKKYISRSIFFIGFLCLFISCYKGNPNNNAGIKPNGLTYGYFQNGSGTNMSQGALVVRVHSNNGMLSTEYYEVDVYGSGTYRFPPNTVQLLIPNLFPGNYNFAVTIGCTSVNAGSTSNCYLRFLNGTATVLESTTTVVDAFL